MFVTVSDVTVWKNIQLLHRMNFHYQNKWSCNTRLCECDHDIWVLCSCEWLSCFGGSRCKVIFGAVIVCLSTLLSDCVMAPLCKYRQRDINEPSLQFSSWCFAEVSAMFPDRGQRQKVILLTLVYLLRMIFFLSLSNIWNGEVLNHSKL